MAGWVNESFLAASEKLLQSATNSLDVIEKVAEKILDLGFVDTDVADEKSAYLNLCCRMNW